MDRSQHQVLISLAMIFHATTPYLQSCCRTTVQLRVHTFEQCLLKPVREYSCRNFQEKAGKLKTCLMNSKCNWGIGCVCLRGEKQLLLIFIRAMFHHALRSDLISPGFKGWHITKCSFSQLKLIGLEFQETDALKYCSLTTKKRIWSAVFFQIFQILVPNCQIEWQKRSTDYSATCSSYLALGERGLSSFIRSSNKCCSQNFYKIEHVYPLLLTLFTTVIPCFSVVSYIWEAHSASPILTKSLNSSVQYMV